MNTVVITNDMIVYGQSKHGGWSRDQLKLLGVDWPPAKGWKARIIGRTITQSQYEMFLVTRNLHFKPKRFSTLRALQPGEPGCLMRIGSQGTHCTVKGVAE